MLKLLQWARNPMIESPQQAQEALISVSSILNAFKEPTHEGVILFLHTLCILQPKSLGQYASLQLLAAACTALLRT